MTRFWFSGEIHVSVGEDYRLAMNALEAALNARSSSVEFAPSIEEIAYLAIILPRGWGDDYPEVTRFTKKSKVLECRLKVDCVAFAAADRSGQFDLLAESLARIPEIAAEKKIPFGGGAYLDLLRESVDHAKKS